WEAATGVGKTFRRLFEDGVGHAGHDNQNRRGIMNFLAHALLAGDDPDLEVGGILGDFVRGRPDPTLPAGLRRGIALHRAVDAFTDRHPDVAAARRLFDPPWRRYAGIMLDVWFDHCLARDFGRWSDWPLEVFSVRLQHRLAVRFACL